ncbi:indolepyruvate decarboxylase [Cohaesibacter marisflavi]|uniref:Indolepyruvate decarboxylase n=1 Tax=Cohaesibacter marisflavi TaxID=655353 RepID=A0A1I5AKA2_9HYPH|nr:thiamine pyrophosphate-binding protein [Cohaesibacter marisflavi]SFN62926.1 indolepyruvate decarboxylase [Cohaesibacter marisflavi]
MTKKTSIGNYLFTRLQEMGIGHIFGVPGDFTLQMLDQIDEVDGLNFVGNCNELNSAYAADGYARLNRISAMITTYGVGDLSALCGVAGACAENVPMVFISGAPPLYAMEGRLRIHHSLAEGNFDNVMNSVREFTVAQTRLTPANAAFEIDRILKICWIERQPVFIQIPSNISHLLIDAPQGPLDLSIPQSDSESLESALALVLKHLQLAERPAVLIDMDVDRTGYTDALVRLVEKYKIPYASFRSGKAILSEASPLFAGIYNGAASEPQVREIIEQSDCLFVTAPSFVEASTLQFIDQMPAETVVSIRGHSSTIGGEVFEGVMAGELISRLADSIEERPEPSVAVQDQTVQPVGVEASRSLTQSRFWPIMGNFFEEGDVILAENGTSNIALTGVKLPEGVSYLSQMVWGAIGYTLPALLGTIMARPERRQILFIGDGSFQLTAQELSTILREGLKPIIFLINNRGYTIERYIQGMKATYNDVANWDYTALMKVFAPEMEAFTASVKTEGELASVLEQCVKQDCASFIEVHLDPFDAPEPLKIFGPKTAELDYGSRRGPRK